MTRDRYNRMKLHLELMGWLCLQEGGGYCHGWSVWDSSKSTYRRESFSGS